MATSEYKWNLIAFERHGKLWLEWSTNAPFRAQQGQISVYSGTSFPSNPQDGRQAWNWDNYSNSPWNTELSWGADWFCSYIAQGSPNGPYEYNIKLVTKGKSNPEVRRSE